MKYTPLAFSKISRTHDCENINIPTALYYTMCFSHIFHHVLFTYIPPCAFHIYYTMCFSRILLHVLFTYITPCAFHIYSTMCFSHILHHVLFAYITPCAFHIYYTMCFSRILLHVLEKHKKSVKKKYFPPARVNFYIHTRKKKCVYLSGLRAKKK